MFGYVVPQKSELKVREFEVYNAYYCAVCHSIRNRYGQLPRLLLTYDSVFLSMILSALKQDIDEITQFRCFTHPTRLRNISGITPQIDYAADMMILLGYHNLRDDYEDERSLIGLAGSTYLKKAAGKVHDKYPHKSRVISENLKKLTEIEKKDSHIFDEAAEPFSFLMEEIFDYEGLDQLSEIYRKVGFHLGKWIYLVDAFDDIEKDIKKNNYNPIIRQFGFGKDNHINESIEDFKKRTNERIRLNLTLYLANIGEQIEKLPLKKNKEIIENIVYLGLLKKTEEILSTEKTEGK